MKKYLAEFFGTFVLTFLACGAASFTGGYSGILGVVGIALIFGTVITTMVYTMGTVSGCHINPAVSLAMLLTKRMNVVDCMGYVIAQMLGGISAALALFGLTKTFDSEMLAQYKLYGYNLTSLGTNGFDAQGGLLQINVWGAIAVEIVLTCVFVSSVLAVTKDESNSRIAGVVIGISLTCVHLFGVPLTGTSVNPARSFGPALIKAIFDGDATALSQVWVFILAPLLGAAIAALLYIVFNAEKKTAADKDTEEAAEAVTDENV